MEQKNDYGPYTPQETDRIAIELKKLGVPFEINKDEEEEKKFSRSDFTNIVTRAEYRTESYLAQIFYFVIDSKDDEIFKQILVRQNLAPQETGMPPDDFSTESQEQEQRKLQEAIVLHAGKKRWTARFLILFVALPVLIVLLLNFYHWL